MDKEQSINVILNHIKKIEHDIERLSKVVASFDHDIEQAIQLALSMKHKDVERVHHIRIAKLVIEKYEQHVHLTKAQIEYRSINADILDAYRKRNN
ncbi:hypothetical protein UFOVP201_16 [uncultured Caudovirales phage]|uniref:Uncharacterized protein n=1 Tax=uncultured Caudovirales phage TaxID=2100421 RepID=A0A6J7WLU4_9CAUD|nr:hypothetical protein UFOVP201_16 [uncultured Caudovirales phage]